MTNSKKKYPYCPRTCKESEKKDKQRANRKMRRNIRQYDCEDENVILKPTAFSNRFDFAKWFMVYRPIPTGYRK